MQYINIITVCLFLCLKWSIEDKIHLRVQPPAVEIMTQRAEFCGKEFGIPAANVYKVFSWTLPDDDTSKKFLYCVDYDCGYADKDGHLIPDNFLAMQFMNGSRKDVENMINDCNKVTKENPFETLYAAGVCLANNITWST